MNLATMRALGYAKAIRPARLTALTVNLKLDTTSVQPRNRTSELSYFAAENCEGSAQVCETNPQLTALSARSSGCLDASRSAYLSVS